MKSELMTVKRIRAYLLIAAVFVAAALSVVIVKGADKRPEPEVEFEQRIAPDDEDVSFSVVSKEILEYSGYGRHVCGKLINDASDLEIDASVNDGILSGSIKGLADYEDWKIRILVKKVNDGIDEGETSYESYEFSGTTEEDRTCCDDWELSEKLKKYDSVTISDSFVISEDVGTILLDGKAAGFKQKDEDLTHVEISGDKGNEEISSSETIFEIKEGIEAKISGLSLKSERICIDNGGSDFKKTCGKVIIVSGSHDMEPYVDTSLVPEGHSVVKLMDVSLYSSGDTALYNGGKVSLLGAVDISGENGIYNMGTIEAVSGVYSLRGEDTALINGSWSHIVYQTLREKDSSYTKEELLDLTGMLYGDLTGYIPGSIYFDSGAGCEGDIRGGSCGVSNGALFKFCRGSITGGSTGVDNAGSFYYYGGNISDCGMYGIRQDGTLFMTGNAACAKNSVIYLTPGHIIMSDGNISADGGGYILLEEKDRKCGREVIRLTDGNEGKAGALCGDSPNGELSDDGRFRLAFEETDGHRAALRKGLGEEQNGKTGRIYLSALYHAFYRDGLNCPLNNVTAEVPEDTAFFWKEMQTFSTDCNGSIDSKVFVYLNEDDITASFRQLYWEDAEGRYSDQKIKRKYDEDHEFRACWDLNTDLYYHGNGDTDLLGHDKKGEKDFFQNGVGIGTFLSNNRNAGDDQEYFLKEELAENGGGTQRFSLQAWEMKSRDQKYDNLRFELGERIESLDFIYEAIRLKSYTLKRKGDSNKVVVDLYALWDAYPVITGKTTYLYDHETEDESYLRSRLAEESEVMALDREDGVLKTEDIDIYTDPSGREFDVRTFHDLGCKGHILVYYGIADSVGNRTVCPVETFILTGDDEDENKEEVFSEKRTMSGGSPDSVDSSPSYIRFVDASTVKTLLSDSIWKRADREKLLEEAFKEGSEEDRYYYNREEVSRVSSIAKEQSAGGNVDDLSCYDGIIKLRDEPAVEEENPVGGHEEEPEIPRVAVSVKTEGTGDTGKVKVSFSLHKGMGAYEIQRCTIRENEEAGEWKRISFINKDEICYSGTDERGCNPTGVYEDKVGAGIFKYRVRAYGSVRGKCDETMPSGEWSNEAGAGYIGAVDGVEVLPGVRSMQVTWKERMGAEGYIIEYGKKGMDPYYVTVPSDEFSCILTKHIDSEGKYMVKVWAFVGEGGAYRSLEARSVYAKVRDIKAPKPAEQRIGNTLSLCWENAGDVIRYEVYRRRVPFGKTEKIDERITNKYRIKSGNELYEYDIRLVAEKLNGKEVSTDSGWYLCIP